MDMHLVWDEAKREANLAKHGLDFADATLVLQSAYRLDVNVIRANEARTQSFAYVFDVLAVLSLAHAARDGETRIISFRRASADEREAYHDWLKNDFAD
ncbi:MAG: BrnT family toxin [Xanthomonadaceae bacterium]|nr:BrnT family toxin [Xanthomonadaceae bacterium]MDP2185938.1 BrnT family toxin [Xanthomonadales bacterium]MDZ4115968.1 BrnT family toxin [Xanthomonadaceae bacterium]MDZ4378425.1 BrnT family toxin [Xanthomonadaceae bacterium]